MLNKKSILVSGLFNVETNVKIRNFPINYYPIDYDFFGVKSSIGGVGYNVVSALNALCDNVTPVTLLANDLEGKNILSSLKEKTLETKFISVEMSETPTSAVLFDESGKRQIYCDLKDIQDRNYDFSKLENEIDNADLIVACNINFNRDLLKLANSKNKLIATDVHVLSNIFDDYNKDFLSYADIVFLSDEALPCPAEEFLLQIKNTYNSQIIVLGQGSKGALMYSRKTDLFYQLPCVSVGKVVNTVGAGDSLFSAFIHYYVKGFDEIEALKRAEIFASYKIGFNGAANGFATEEKIEELYKTIDFKINEIKR